MRAKGLERGRFRPRPADGVVTIFSAQLGYLLSRIDWRHLQETEAAETKAQAVATSA
jgi:hypothetical protein